MLVYYCAHNNYPLYLLKIKGPPSKLWNCYLFFLLSVSKALVWGSYFELVTIPWWRPMIVIGFFFWFYIFFSCMLSSWLDELTLLPTSSSYDLHALIIGLCLDIDWFFKCPSFFVFITIHVIKLKLDLWPIYNYIYMLL